MTYNKYFFENSISLLFISLNEKYIYIFVQGFMHKHYNLSVFWLKKPVTNSWTQKINRLHDCLFLLHNISNYCHSIQ